MKYLASALSALTTVLVLMMIILYLPYLLSAALIFVAVMVVVGLVAWLWIRYKLRHLIKQAEEQMQQMQHPTDFEGLNSGAPERPFGQTGPMRYRPDEEGPVIHIKPEEL